MKKKNESFVIAREKVKKPIKCMNIYIETTITTNNLPTKSGSNRMDETIAGKHMMLSFK